MNDTKKRQTKTKNQQHEWTCAISKASKKNKKEREKKWNNCKKGVGFGYCCWKAAAHCRRHFIIIYFVRFVREERFIFNLLKQRFQVKSCTGRGGHENQQWNRKLMMVDVQSVQSIITRVRQSTRPSQQHPPTTTKTKEQQKRREITKNAWSVRQRENKKNTRTMWTKGEMLFFYLPFRETMVSRMAFEMYCCTNAMYRTNLVKRRPTSRKLHVKIDCILWEKGRKEKRKRYSFFVKKKIHSVTKFDISSSSFFFVVL